MPRSMHSQNLRPSKKDHGSSKLANRFQSLAIEEEGWTTVKSTTSPASPTSFCAKDSRNPSTHITQAAAAGKRLDLDWRVLKPPNASDQSTVSRLAQKPIAGASWISQHRENGGQTRYRPFSKNTNGNPNIKKPYGKDFFRPGLIIRADLHEEDFKAAHPAKLAPKTIVAPGGATEVPKERNIHTKERKMIIVACYERHYICILLYSHEGQGLKNKNEAEYISVRDHRIPLSEYKELSAHGTLTTEYLHEGLEPYLTMTVAHVTYPISRSYELAVVHEGHLKPADLDLLVKLFNRYAPRERKAR